MRMLHSSLCSVHKNTEQKNNNPPAHANRWREDACSRQCPCLHTRKLAGPRDRVEKKKNRFVRGEEKKLDNERDSNPWRAGERYGEM